MLLDLVPLYVEVEKSYARFLGESPCPERGRRGLSAVLDKSAKLLAGRTPRRALRLFEIK